MTYDKATTYLRSIVGSQDWVRFPVVIRATPLMLRESKIQISEAREFVRTLTLLKAQQKPLAIKDAAQAKEDQERAWLLAYQ